MSQWGRNQRKEAKLTHVNKEPILNYMQVRQDFGTLRLQGKHEGDRLG